MAREPNEKRQRGHLLISLSFLATLSLCLIGVWSFSNQENTTQKRAARRLQDGTNDTLSTNLTSPLGNSTNATDSPTLNSTNTTSSFGNSTNETNPSSPSSAPSLTNETHPSANGTSYNYSSVSALPDPTKFSASNDSSILNIHVVAHTHDDVGWLKTVEQYYRGENETIQRANVRAILDSTLEALQQNENRTFVYVEQKFFSMWWMEKSQETRAKVKRLVREDQYHFVNGGWSMHDEACAHFMGMVDSTTTGHDFLKGQLGVIPKVGWQLDPFGHSASQASLLTSKVGFDALYFGRIDYQDRELRQETKQCEGLWDASAENFGDSSTAIFWGLTGEYNGNYGPPEGFGFRPGSSSDPLLQNMTQAQMLERLDSLLLPQLQRQANHTLGRDILLTMGTDFRYQDAPVSFKSVDLMIQGLSAIQEKNPDRIKSMLSGLDGDLSKIRVFYSSPEYYTKQKFLSQQAWQTKTDDFFPYADNDHAYWTGYFTSRPALKRLERQASSFLAAARQLEALIGIKTDTRTGERRRCDCGLSLFPLEDALGIAQHHDGVSGTAKQHVAYDYAKRLTKGMNLAGDFLVALLRKVLLVQHSTAVNDLSFCPLMNETTCEVATKNSDSSNLWVVVYNALAQERNSWIRLPVGSEGTYSITRVSPSASQSNYTSQEVPSVPVFETPLKEGASYVLYVSTGKLPPVGITVFNISLLKDQSAEKTLSSTMISDAADGIRNVSKYNGEFVASFNASTGMLASISAGNNSNPIVFHQQWGYYLSYDKEKDNVTSGGTNPKQNSGAYIFRPHIPTQVDSFKTVDATGGSFIDSIPGMIEIRSKFDVDWISQVTRIYEDEPYVEIEYTVGPIDVEDARGKEIVSRYFSSSLESGSTCKTDSNAREFIVRTRNFRPSWNLNVTEEVAGNYYPVNAAICLENDEASIAILTDRSQGGGSIVNGSVELMVHRRTLYDDSRGVAEPINETDGGIDSYPPFGNAARHGDGLVIRGKHRILVGKGNSGASLARSQMDSAFLDPVVFVGSSPTRTLVSWKRSQMSAVNASLPKNVMLVTYARRRDRVFLVRLAHQYAVKEHPLFSQPARVDLTTLFDGFEITEVKEMTLSANQEYSSFSDRRLDWTNSGDLPPPISGTVVDLSPMDIRTFIVKLEGAMPSPAPPPNAPSHAPHHGHSHPTHAPHAPHRPQSQHGSNGESGADNSSLNPGLFALVAVVIVVAAFFFARRKMRYRQFDRTAGHDLELELQMQGYRPGLT